MFAQQLGQQQVLPVLVLESVKQADWVGHCFTEAGLRYIEVTLRTEHALSVIEYLNRHFPALSVGAGTVLTPDQIPSVLDAGADFIVAPGATEALLQAGSVSPVPFLPGVMTPSEVMRARDYGFQLQKFFPAEAAGGTALLKAMSAPLADVEFCPTGGIGLHNMADYLALENVPVVGGSWLVSGQALLNTDSQSVTDNITQLLQVLTKMRG